MQKYEVVERVNRQVVRERRWTVEAISEQDAIRAVINGEAARGYRGETETIASRGDSQWKVDGQEMTYQPADAVPVDDGVADIGGGD